MPGLGLRGIGWPKFVCDDFITLKKIAFLVDGKKTFKGWLSLKVRQSCKGPFAYILKDLQVFYLNNFVLFLDKNFIDCMPIISNKCGFYYLDLKFFRLWVSFFLVDENVYGWSKDLQVVDIGGLANQNLVGVAFFRYMGRLNVLDLSHCKDNLKP